MEFAAKRTTMWLMILIGVFYLFRPFSGCWAEPVAGALCGHWREGHRQNCSRTALGFSTKSMRALGSILSGITCAGASPHHEHIQRFARVDDGRIGPHDVYGRMFRPNSSPDQRMRAFKVCAVIVWRSSDHSGMQVEPFANQFHGRASVCHRGGKLFPVTFS